MLPEEPVNERGSVGPLSGPSRGLVAGLMVLGAALRAAFLLRNRPLWLDEAMIAVGVTERSYGDLLGPLDYMQTAPLGWLSIEWALVQWLGDHEIVLRLAPWLMSVFTIPFFFLAARRLLTPAGSAVALLLFCLSEPMVYYSAEVKPYSADVLVAVVLLWLTLRIVQDGAKAADVIWLGLAGTVFMLLSFTSVLVMAGCLAVAFSWSLAHRRRAAPGLVIVGVVFLIALGTYYVNYLQPKSNPDLVEIMQQTRRMAPMPPRCVADVRWYLDTLVNFFVDPMGFKAMGLAMIATAIGAIGVARRSRWLLALLLAPLLLGLLASMLQKYPFTTFEQYEHPLRGRYIIYTVPPVLLLTAGGLAWLWHALTAYRRWLGVLLLAVILWHPLYRIAQNIKQPPDIGDIRACMAYLKSHVKESDVVYHSWVAEPPFRFYRSKYGLDDVASFGGARPIVRKAIDPDAWTRIDDWKQSELLFDAHRGRRVWLLFIHHPSSFGYEDEKNLLNHLDDRGKRADRFRANGASLTLYEMSP